MNGWASPAVLGLALLLLPCGGDAAEPASPLPGPGFDGDLYANLWTKSPFSIATADAPVASQDFQLVGMAQFDGVSYITLIEKQSGEHFILASDKPVKNLTLVSIARGPGVPFAIIQRDGVRLTLQEENASAPTIGTIRDMNTRPPGMVISSNPAVGEVAQAVLPPRARFHHFINVPPPPAAPH